MPSTRFVIDETTLPFGPAEVFFGDASVAGGLTPIGLIEGDVVAQIKRKFNNLTFPEHTGDAPIKSLTNVDGITVTVPLMLTDEAMMARLLPRGVINLGTDNFEPVVPQTLLIISREEVDPDTGLSLSAGPPQVWAPAAPKNALWLWKAVPSFDRLVWGFTDMGKRMVDVTFEAHYDTTKPDGNKLATFGDPVLAGITDLLI